MDGSDFAPKTLRRIHTASVRVIPAAEFPDKLSEINERLPFGSFLKMLSQFLLKMLRTVIHEPVHEFVKDCVTQSIRVIQQILVERESGILRSILPSDVLFQLGDPDR